MMRKKSETTRNAWVFGAILALSCSHICPAWADTESTLNAILVVKEDYRSNALFTEANRTEEWVTVLAPRVEGSLQSERMTGSLSLGIDHEFFADDNDLDATNQLHSLGATFQAGSTWSLGLDTSFGEDHGIESQLTTTGILTDRRRRRTWSVNPSVNFELGERTTLSPTGRLIWAENEDSDLLDYRIQGGALILSHELRDMRTILSAEMGGANWDYGSQTITTGDLSLTLEYGFSETFSIETMLGYRYLREDWLDLDEEHALEARFQIYSEHEPISVELIASRGVNTSPVATAVEQSRVDMILSLHPAQRLILYLLGLAQHNDSLLGARDVESDVVQGTAGFGYQIGKRLVIQSYYQYLHLFNHVGNAEIDGHFGVVAFRLQKDPIEDLSALPFEGMRYETRNR